jgi:hypothetical protein
MKTLELEKITRVRDELLQHRIYGELNTPERVKVFMKHHVFAVWDFMSLLKRLQQSLTGITVPWMPNPHADYARFINEIVLGEETDEDGQGGYISHFELYLKAMNEVDANVEPIARYLQRLKEGVDPFEALSDQEIPNSIAHFVTHSLHTAQDGEPHEVAASFFFGREDIIPDMFGTLVQEIEKNGFSATQLKYYLHRHIELDGDEHGPLAEKLLVSLCDNNSSKIEEAEKMAQGSLQARIKLWDGVLEEIERKGL